MARHVLQEGTLEPRGYFDMGFFTAMLSERRCRVLPGIQTGYTAQRISSGMSKEVLQENVDTGRVGD